MFHELYARQLLVKYHGSIDPFPLRVRVSLHDGAFQAPRTVTMATLSEADSFPSKLRVSVMMCVAWGTDVEIAPWVSSSSRRAIRTSGSRVGTRAYRTPEKIDIEGLYLRRLNDALRIWEVGTEGSRRKCNRLGVIVCWTRWTMGTRSRGLVLTTQMSRFSTWHSRGTRGRILSWDSRLHKFAIALDRCLFPTSPLLSSNIRDFDHTVTPRMSPSRLTSYFGNILRRHLEGDELRSRLPSSQPKANMGIDRVVGVDFAGINVRIEECIRWAGVLSFSSTTLWFEHPRVAFFSPRSRTGGHSDQMRWGQCQITWLQSFSPTFCQ